VGLLDCVEGKCREPLGPGAVCGTTGLAQCDVSKEVFCKASAPPNPAGTCAPFLKVGLGETCGVDATKAALVDCTKGACMPSPSKGTCVAHVADGEACSDLLPCLPPALCLDKKCTIRNPATCQ
jgi:hypothetical protein